MDSCHCNWSSLHFLYNSGKLFIGSWQYVLLHSIMPLCSSVFAFYCCLASRLYTSSFFPKHFRWLFIKTHMHWHFRKEHKPIYPGALGTGNIVQKMSLIIRYIVHNLVPTNNVSFAQWKRRLLNLHLNFLWKFRLAVLTSGDFGSPFSSAMCKPFGGNNFTY